MSKPHKIKISVIIPTYNRPVQVTKVIRSLTNQKYQEYEIIVVDDGSDNKNQKKLMFLTNKKKITILRCAHNGQGAARNRGIEHARGEILAFLDDDCIPSKNWLASIEKNMKLCRCIANSVVPIRKGEDLALEQKRKGMQDRWKTEWSWGFHENSFPTCANLAIKQSVLGKNRFNPSLKVLEDKDLLLRLMKKGLIITRIGEMQVVHMNERESSSTMRKHFLYGKEEANIFKKYFRNKAMISWQFLTYKEWSTNFPFTLYIRVRPFEIVLLCFLLFLMVNPKLSLGSIGLIAIFYLIRYKNMKYAMRLILDNFKTTMLTLTGNIAGSIKYNLLFL